MSKSAGILVIGDEILSGKFADENASYLIGALRPLGVDLRRIEIIADAEGEIADSVARLCERCDLVFTSGGVGPTHDDVTIAGIARRVEVEVVAHPELIRLLEGHYGSPLSDAHRRLARIPAGGELVIGSNPRWPVMRFRNVYILPGVPALFRRGFDSIAETFRGAPRCLGRVYVSLEETELSAALDAVVAAHPRAQLGSYPRLEETAFRVMLTVESEDRPAAEAALAALVQALGPAVVRVDPVVPLGPA